MRWALPLLALAWLLTAAAGSSDHRVARSSPAREEVVGCLAQHVGAVRFCRAVEHRRALRVIRRLQVREVLRTHTRFKRSWYRGWNLRRLADANHWERSRLAYLRRLPTWLPTDPVALGELMAAREGWTGGEWECLYQVVEHESGWKVTAWNRQSGASDPLDDPYGAYGLPQSHPPSKLASAGPDWRTSAQTQLRWLVGYVRSRWGDPCSAWAHWRLYLAGGSDYSY